MARTGAVVREGMAGEAAAVDRFARGCIALRRPGRACTRAERKGSGRRQAKRAQVQDMNAEGTGASPSALRRTAQCIASSPRMLAAALARSRLPNTGTAPRYALTAPFSSDAANRSTSAWVFSLSVGKVYLSFAETALPPSFAMVFARTSACSL